MTDGGIFDRPGPRWFSIPAHRPFVEDLARGLMDGLGGEPEALADALVLVPTRRGARALADAFVAAGGGRAVLLPQIRALGDLDEGEPPFEPGEAALDLPPAISPLRRRFELARLVSDHAHLFDRPLDAASVLELADALAGFLDSLQIEERDEPDRIDALVQGDLAEHWRRSADFLRIATRLWPARLKEIGLVDVTERRTLLLRALAEGFGRRPPRTPLIAAGSTGTAPATADLMAVVADAPMGAVVLPGLDKDLADNAWAEVQEGHPQKTLKTLLDRFGLTRDDVDLWPVSDERIASGRWRRRVINEALRPAERTADWVQVIAGLRREGATEGINPIEEGLKGLSLVAARTEEEAAAVAALLMRETLETPGKTAALVTPDPVLARRVSARLARWGAPVDSSAGGPLSGAPVGQLALLMAGLAVDPCDPVRLLAVIKHPLAAFGMEADVLERARRRLERRALRGARPLDFRVLAARVEPKEDDKDPEDPAPSKALAEALGAAVDLASAPFAETAAPVDAARALARAMEAAAAAPAGGTGSLWSGAAGEAAASLLAGLIEDGAALPQVDARGFLVLMERLVGGEIVRTGGAAHPRLRILGAIEARLIRADRLVLAGLEEGVWPRSPPVDPFLSRTMRRELGLPSPERRVGLSAHDFAQAACAPEVIMIHAERRGGQPAVKSRWLWRLETLAKGAGAEIPRRDDALAWARSLEAPDPAPPPSLQRATQPRPTPPVAVRPRKLAVTRIENWVRDPYAIYGRYILKLRTLDPPDQRVDQKARGTAIHAAFERFARDWAAISKAEAGAWFSRLYIEELRKAGSSEAALARETPLAVRVGQWAAQFETDRRLAGAQVHVEREGELRLPEVDFTVTAKADRIEVGREGAAILDFKTGPLPGKDELKAGFAPQLPLTGAILSGGGFAGLGAPTVDALTYVRVTGREPPAETVPVDVTDMTTAQLVERALEGLKRLVAHYDKPTTPYLSRPSPKFVKLAGDYDHLARVREWSAGGEEGE